MHRCLMALLRVLVVLSLSSGCASSLDRDLTKFEPTKVENNQAYFKFTAFADPVYPLDSKDAETIRLGWLEQWLSDNGYAGAKWEILSRKPVLRNKGLFGGIYDLYYDVRVQAK